MGAPETTETDAAAPDRWTLIRDVAVFQVKLVADGLRDLLLVPVSLVAGVVSLFSGTGDRSGTEFYDLLRLGKQSERWINLFGAAGRVHDTRRLDHGAEAGDIDTMMERVESFLVDEYRKGGLTAQAKDRLDNLLDAVKHRTGSGPDEPGRAP